MILPSVSSQELNLSYQDLGDPFQQENFLRILRRLIRVEKLQLVDNSLTNLSSVRLPRYEPRCATAVFHVKITYLCNDLCFSHVVFLLFCPLQKNICYFRKWYRNQNCRTLFSEPNGISSCVKPAFFFILCLHYNAL